MNELAQNEKPVRGGMNGIAGGCVMRNAPDRVEVGHNKTITLKEMVKSYNQKEHYGTITKLKTVEGLRIITTWSSTKDPIGNDTQAVHVDLVIMKQRDKINHSTS